MPAPIMSMPSASGMDIQKTIQQLMALEKKPILRIELENKRNEYLIKAWQETRKRVSNLEEKSRLLYSFAGPFARKRVVASDDGAVTGEAAPDVQGVSQNLEVVRLATHHQFHSDPVDKNQDLPAGSFSFTIGEKSHTFRFDGGKLSSLFNLIKNQSGEDYDVFLVQVDQDHSLLGFTSKKSGKPGAFHFQDPDSLLRKIGLLGMPEGQEGGGFLWRSDALSPYGLGATTPRMGGFDVRDSGRTLFLQGGGAVRYNGAVPGDGRLLLDVVGGDSRQKSGAPEDEGNPPAGEKGGKGGETSGAKGNGGAGDGSTGGSMARGPDVLQTIVVGPDISVNVGDVHLHGYNVERSRSVPGLPLPGEKGESAKNGSGTPAGGSPESGSGKGTGESGKGEAAGALQNGRAGIGVVWTENGERKEKILPFQEADRRYDIDLAGLTGGRKPDYIYLFSGPGSDTLFKNPQLLAKKSAEGLEPIHVTEGASDALIRLNGVDITRPENSGITDIIAGVKLNLNRITKGAINVRVEADTDDIVKRIRDWVTAYNDLLKFVRENSQAGNAEDFKIKRPDEGEDDISEGFRKLQDSRGIFSADSTARELASTMRMVTGNAYPSTFNPGYRVLSDIGISTGGAGSNWDQIKAGFLEVDEDKLRATLASSPDSVKNLFASDTNEDSTIDNGVAYRMSQSLQPYSRVSGGLITTRIDLLKTKITDNKDRIDRLQLSMKEKEEGLRRKFGYMEGAIRESKATGNYLKNNLPSAGQ